MSIEHGLLSAIRDEPDDDGIRLVYADWLEEQGNIDRADFIRLQCQIATMDLDDPGRPAMELRAEDLLVAHRAEWTEGLPENIAHMTVFRRGFPEYAQVKAKRSEFLARIRGILALPLPPRTLDLKFKSTASLAEFNDLFEDDPRGVRLGITLQSREPGDEISRVLACQNILPHVRMLTMQADHSPGQIEQLSSCENLRCLKNLSYCDPRLTPGEADMLFHSKQFHLESFVRVQSSLDQNYAPSHYDYLGESDFSRLHSLGGGVRIDDEDEDGRHLVMQRLANNASIEGIRRLHLGGSNISHPDLAVVLQSPHAKNVRYLHVPLNESLGNGTGSAIAQSGLPLHALWTYGSGIRQQGFRTVIESPAGQSLRTLECGKGVAIGELFRDISLPHLRRLIALQCHITREDLFTMIKACPSLRHVDIRGSGIDHTNITEIFASGDIDRLHMLKIDRGDMNFLQRQAYDVRFPAMNDIPDWMPV